MTYTNQIHQNIAPLKMAPRTIAHFACPKCRHCVGGIPSESLSIKLPVFCTKQAKMYLEIFRETPPHHQNI